MARAAEIKEHKPPARSSRRGLTRAGEPRTEPTAVYSRSSFCKAFGLSESFYHKLQNEGLGPVEMRVGAKVLITHESAREWCRARERATASA